MNATTQTIDNNNDNAYCYSHEETVQLSLRCLINALNQEHDNDYSIGKIFISKSNKVIENSSHDSNVDENDGVRGIERVLYVMNKFLQFIIATSSSFDDTSTSTSFSHHEFLKRTQRAFEVLYWGIRLIYMLVSQR